MVPRVEARSRPAVRRASATARRIAGGPAPLYGKAPAARRVRRAKGPVAQWLEPTAHNGLVAGSSPAGPTTHSGFATPIGRILHPDWGLSPRVRRSRARAARTPDFRGSISAGAEEPYQQNQCVDPKGVYLRACGGAVAVGLFRHRAEGLSPRVRRSRGRPPCFPGNLGSISARAEEPQLLRHLQEQRRVYLRACGGA